VNDVGTILGKWLECSSSDNRRGFVLANDGLFKIVAVKCGQVEVSKIIKKIKLSINIFTL
jgi:hypothetical protein